MLLSCGATAALPSSMTLACNPSPVNFLINATPIVNCPGFSVSGGAILGAAVGVTVDAFFTSSGSVSVTSTETGSAVFTPNSVTVSLAGLGFQSLTSLGNNAVTGLGGSLFASIPVSAVSSIGATVSSFEACYFVNYTYVGTGTAVGPEGTGACATSGSAGSGSAQTPEPASAWLILPGLVGYGFIRRNGKLTSDSASSRT